MNALESGGKLYPYAILSKEDIYENITERIMDIQKELGIEYPENYKDEISIIHEDDPSTDQFLDELEFMQVPYKEDNETRTLVPEAHLCDGTVLSLKELQSRVCSLSFRVNYMCREGRYERSSEYGFYTTDPAYTNEIMSPDIDVTAMFRDLQRYADRHPESFREYPEREKTDEPELEL